MKPKNPNDTTCPPADNRGGIPEGWDPSSNTPAFCNLQDPCHGCIGYRGTWCKVFDKPFPAWENISTGNPLKVQVGGNHYKGFEVQPVEYIMKNRLNFLQGCIVKRITRYNQPTGKGLEDLTKIKHEIDLLIELEGLNE